MVNLLLLLGLITYSAQFKTSTISVSGEKRGNIRLRCEHEDNNIVQIDLFTRSEDISVCETEECRGRVFKEGNCDVVIKNLIFSDAGKYTLRIYYNNDQTELKYHLHIHDEVSVNMGEQLKLDVLLSEADEVQHQRRRSTEWMKVWSRSDGVQSQRISIRDRNLIINHFTASDAGTYEVLDSEGELLITVTVRASGSMKKHEAPHLPAPKYWTLSQKLSWFFKIYGVLVVLTILIVFLVALMN